MNPELVRWAVARIKALALLKEPNYELPADSHIEAAVKEIIARAQSVQASDKGDD